MKDPIFKLLAVYILAIILGLLIIGVFFSSCTLTKKSQKASSDLTSVSKSDSTSLKKSDTGNKLDSTWWKEIINFFPKDTVINNTTVPVYNYYPSQIIREGGSIKKEDWQNYYDSLNEARKDSTRNVESTSKTESKTKVGIPLLFQIGLLLIGLEVFKFFGSKFSIVKR